MTERFQSADLSAIIPVCGRHRELAALYREYKTALDALSPQVEMIVVIDGPQPQVTQQIEQLLQAGEPLTVIELTRSFGEATALMAGFQRATAPVIVTLPAYHQVEAQEIGKLVAALDGVDMAIAHRWPRAGSRWEFARRRAFHGIIAKVTGQHFRDLGCGVRAFKRRVLEEISLYGDQHRFLPVLANRQGFRVAEIDVRQSPKDRFERGYTVRDYTRRALDIFSVFFLVRFTKRPLRFFGMIGATTFGLGVLLTTWLVIDRLILHHPLADRPALILSSLLVVMGLQLFALGLLGELIIFTHARELKDYKIDRIIEYAPAEAAQLAAATTVASGPMERDARTSAASRPVPI
ncbi:MAG TPA: glycosyltransferase [Steroidobacteraceae bacterium]|jgi:glycosyltransferase involved in cell wall biosynthesis|nr:glycosyltransferase [Steroidobacteraceae bacterium]